MPTQENASESSERYTINPSTSAQDNNPVITRMRIKRSVETTP